MTIFCSVVVRTRPLPYTAASVSDDVERVRGQPADGGREPDVVPPVPLPVDAHVIPDAAGRRRRGAVGQRVAEVLLLQHLAESLRSPVRDEELDPGPVPQPAVAVVPEQPRHSRPYLGDLPFPDERAEAPGRSSGWWTGRRRPTGRSRPRPSPFTTPTNAMSLISWMAHCAAQPLIEDLNLRGRLENVGITDVLIGDRSDLRRGVDDLVSVDAGQRAAEDHPRRVAAGLRGAGPTDSRASQIAGTFSISIQ